MNMILPRMREKDEICYKTSQLYRLWKPIALHLKMQEVPKAVFTLHFQL